MGIVKEFKEFISRGSVIDLAVGVVIGGAFTSIVNSLVNDIIMPPLGYLLAGVDFTEMKAVLPGRNGGEDVAIMYGNFIQTVITFLIIALVLFFVVRGINKLHSLGKAEETEEEEAAPEPTETELLGEILTQLKIQNGEPIADAETTAEES